MPTLPTPCSRRAKTIVGVSPGRAGTRNCVIFKIFFALSALFGLVDGASAEDRLPAPQIGSAAPDFSLTDQNGKSIRLAELKGSLVVLEWFNPNCPFVRKQYRNGDMQALQRTYKEKGIQWFMINSSHVESRDFQTPEQQKEFMREKQVVGASILTDSSGAVGRAYNAKTTPHLFIIDRSGVLRYKGAIDDDDSTSGNPHDAHNYVGAALDALLAGQLVDPAETDSYGCSVKYAQ